MHNESSRSCGIEGMDDCEARIDEVSWMCGHPLDLCSDVQRV